MNDQLQMFGEATSPDSPSAISSPESESGVTRSDALDGPTTDRSGPEAAPAPASRAQVKGAGLMTLVTSGLTGIPSSASDALQSSLESKLMTLLDSAGSTLFVETWKRRVTPLRRRYWEHTASALRTSDSGCTSVPTPDAHPDLPNSSTNRGKDYGGNRPRMSPCGLGPAAQLASVCSPTAMDANRGGQPARPWDTGVPLTQQVALATVATPRSEDSQCAGAHRVTPDTLHSQAHLASISTPSARDWKDTSGMSESGVDPDGSTRSRLDQLPRQAQLADSGQTAIGGTAATASGGQLEPAYSRWLQGLPQEWDVCADMATASLRRLPKSSSKRTSKA
jgi:hypothetical protein